MSCRRCWRHRRRGRHQDRHDLRLHRPVRGRRLQAGRHRQQDRHRHDQREAAASRATRSSPIDADAQSKTDVAINEAERLLNEAEGRPAHGRLLERALRADGRQGRRRQEVHVGQRLRRLRGVQGQEPAIRVPPAGALRPVRRGLLLVHRRERQERSSARRSRTSRSRSSTRTAPTASASPWATRPSARSSACRSCTRRATRRPPTDLSALVTKLRRAQPDVILHTGYNPDITLFLRQAKEAGLKFAALIGHGAGYGQIDKLIETFKDDVNYFYNVDPVAAQLLDPKTLKPGARRAHRRDGQALQGRDRRAGGAAARLDGLQPGLDLPDRRAAARDQEVRRLSIPRRCARRRSRPTFRRAAPSRATA